MLRIILIHLIKDLVKKLSERNKIQVIKYNAKFIDIGTPQDLKKFQKNIDFFKKIAVFLDRDGVINYDYGYVRKKKFSLEKKCRNNQIFE